MHAFLARCSRNSCGLRFRGPKAAKTRVRQWLFALFALLALTPALAQETVSYTYDGRGRLVWVAHSGGANNGISSSYTYDPADNRTNVTVSGTSTLNISPTNLPNGSVGVSYSQTITVVGGTGPYTYSTTAGTLPAGLSLSSSGVLSGTPTTGGSYSFTVTATDSAGHSNSRSYTVRVAVPVSVSPASLPNGTVGTVYSKTISASGGSGNGYIYQTSSGTLPAGLTLTSAGVLSGTPSTAATYSFTISAIDSAGNSGGRAYSVTVVKPPLAVSPSTLPSGTVGVAYSAQISASGGTSPYTYTTTSGTLPAGLSLGGSGLLSGTPTAAASYSFTITATDSTGNTGAKAYSVTTAAPVTVGPASLPGGTVGTAYSQTITASGGTSPYTFAYSGSLPAGLTLSSSGILSGTPTTAATYSFTVTATDSASRTGSRAYSVAMASSGGVCSGVSYSINNNEVVEGSPLTFTITKSGSTSSSCTVSYATASGTAVAGTNYVATSGTLTFTATQTTQTVTVTTNGGMIPSGKKKTMYLNLSSPSGGASLTNTQGIGTLDSDGSICATC